MTIRAQLKSFVVLAFLSGSAGVWLPPAAADERCPGRRFNIESVGRGISPYIALTAGGRTGLFLLDYGSTQSSLVREGVAKAASTPSRFVAAPFSLPSFASGRFRVSTYDMDDQQRGSQAGVVGTDFLSLLTADFSFRDSGSDVVLSASSCDPATLKARGMIAVRQDGFFSSDVTTLDAATPNVPVLYVDIGGVTVPAQIDTGYDDRILPPSIDINDALYDKLIAKGVALQPTRRIAVATCDGTAVRDVYAAPQTKIMLQTRDGRAIGSVNGASLIRKTVNGCGGIAEMHAPAAQLGMAIIRKLGSVVFDPKAGIVWVAVQR